MKANAVLAKAVRLALIAGATSATLSSAVAIAAENGASEEKVERIAVTGSRIKRTDMETANPVTVLNADDLAKQGFGNVQDALENLSSSTGAINTQSVHGFTPAASAISLRGAGANRTLTLINGKRLNQYPKALNGTSNFVDTANLPMEAVARIEILQSGASAIYGADAVGGVVNIILKEDFEGVAVKYRHGDTTLGGGASDRVAVSLGASNDRGNVSTFIEFNVNEQLKATDRSKFGLDTDKVPHSLFSSYSSYGARIESRPNKDGKVTASNQRKLTAHECLQNGLFWDQAANKGTGRCGYDRSKERDLGPESKRFISSTLFNYELAEDLRLKGRVDFAKSKSITRIEPASTNGVKVAVNGDKLEVDAYGFKKTFADKAVALGGDFKNATNGNYRYIRRLNGLGQRTGETNTQNFYGSVGVEGMIFDEYSWDASANYGKSELDVYNSNYTLKRKLFDYVTEGENGRSLLNPIAKEAYEKLKFSPFNRANSSLTNFQANVSGVAFELPEADAEFALGAEWSRQSYATDSDSESKAKNVPGNGGSSGQGVRKFWAAYSELRLPLLEELTVNLAARYDNYSDFGGNVTPSIAVEYRPIDELLLRTSYNKVFRAPDMQRVYGNPTDSHNQVIDNKRCIELGGTPGDDKIADDNLNSICNELHITQTTGANKDLEAEKGYSANIGAVYGGDNFNASIDVWEWKLNGMVQAVSASRQAREYELYKANITRDASGQITHINSIAQNLSFSKVRGVDLEAGYNFDLNNLGELKLNLRTSYLLKSISQLDAAAPVDNDIDDGGLPRLKGNLVATWLIEDFSATLGAYYTGRHHSLNYKAALADEKRKAKKENREVNFDESAHETATYIKWNASASYNISDDASVKFGVNNIFNKGPNFDPTEKGWPHYDRAQFNARGREWFVETEVKF